MNVNRTFLTIAALGVTGASASTYTVKDGDTLASVAEAANVEPTELLALNNLTSGTLQVGQTIKLGKSSFIKPVMAGDTSTETSRPVIAATDAVTVALGVISAAPQSIAPSAPSAMTAQSVALPAVSTAPMIEAASISAKPVQKAKAEPVVLGAKTDATPKRFSTPLVAAPVKTQTSSAKVVASTPVVSKFATKNDKPIVAAKPVKAAPVAKKIQKAKAAPVQKAAVAKKPSAASQLAAQAAAKARAVQAQKSAKAKTTATKPKTQLTAQAVAAKPKPKKTALVVKSAGGAAVTAVKTALVGKPAKKAAPKRVFAKVKPKKAAPKRAVAKAKVTRKAVTAKRRVSRGGTRISTAASRYLGIRYVLGGMGGRGGIDCSAYTMRVMHQLGVNLPRTSRSQWRVGRAVSSRNLRPGDLVFFNTNGRGVSHVGIYMGNGMFANANSYRGKTLIEPLFGNSYWAKRYIGARRVLN